MKVAIIGSRFKIPPVDTIDPEERARLVRRNARVRAEVEKYVAQLPPGTIVVSGGAQGVDTWAAVAARAQNLTLIEIYPDYVNNPPKQAPLIRNEEIAAECDRMVCFWDGASKGSMHAVSCADQARKPTKTFRFSGNGFLV